MSWTRLSTNLFRVYKLQKQHYTIPKWVISILCPQKVNNSRMPPHKSFNATLRAANEKKLRNTFAEYFFIFFDQIIAQLSDNSLITIGDTSLVLRFTFTSEYNYWCVAPNNFFVSGANCSRKRDRATRIRFSRLYRFVVACNSWFCFIFCIRKPACQHRKTGLWPWDANCGQQIHTALRKKKHIYFLCV